MNNELKNKGLIGEHVPETEERTHVQKAAASVDGGGSSERRCVGVTAGYRESESASESAIPRSAFLH